MFEVDYNTAKVYSADLNYEDPIARKYKEVPRDEFVAHILNVAEPGMFRIPKVRNTLPEMQALKNEMSERREKGATHWGAERWMKSPATYRTMDTFSLVDECFSRPIFGTEIMAFDDPLVGLIRLQVYHDGFQELFGRNDMWRGIIHYMDRVSAILTPGIELKDLVMHMLNVNGLEHLYQVDGFAKQVAGHEQEYLDAHLRLIHAFIRFIDEHDETRKGKAYGFFGESVVVANQAVALYRRVRSDDTTDLELRLVSTITPGRQDMAEVRRYLQQVIDVTEKR